MFKIIKNITSIFILTFIMCFQTILAQGGDDPGGIDGDPGSAVPIDDWVPAILFLVIATVLYYTYKKKEINKI